MKVTLACGKTGLEVELPDETRATVVRPEYVKELPGLAGAVRDAQIVLFNV